MMAFRLAMKPTCSKPPTPQQIRNSEHKIAAARHEAVATHSAGIPLLQDGLQVRHLVGNRHRCLPALQQLGLCVLRLNGLGGPCWCCCCHLLCCHKFGPLGALARLAGLRRSRLQAGTIKIAATAKQGCFQRIASRMDGASKTTMTPAKTCWYRCCGLVIALQPAAAAACGFDAQSHAAQIVTDAAAATTFSTCFSCEITGLPWKLAAGGRREACGREERCRPCRELAALRCALSSIVQQLP